MTDYPELYRQLAREIVKHEGKIEGDARQFVAQLAEKLRAKGHVLTPEIEAELTDYLGSMQAAIKTGIEKAVTVAVALPGLPQSATVAKLTEQAFNERWPDGLKLSDRLWDFNETARTGLTNVLRDAAKTGASVNKTVYDMQRTIERAAGGQRFKIVEQYADDWVKELHAAGVGLIHDPQSRELWNATVAEVEERILSLKATGTRSAAERVFDQIKKAVASGREELADKAVKWWLYDKQLYGLKRIARTEMATAMHKAVIASTEDDETIIGYQWRLSASHPVTDICDYYASVEMGLGKGVFTKDAVPRGKAHPHCVLGDTIIHAPGAISAATKSFYSGAIVEIITRNSGKLSCTPNHAILTQSGWVEAQFIDKGHNIISATSSNPGAFYPNDNDMPSTIEQIFNSAIEAHGVSSITVPVAAEHFHGDGGMMDGNVQIVHVDGLLLSDDNPGINKHFGKNPFSIGNSSPASFLGDGIGDSLFNRFGHSPNSGMCISSDSLPVFQGGSAHIERLAFAGRSDGDAVFFEDSIDDDPRDSMKFSQSFDGFPGFIEGDNFRFWQSNLAAHIDTSITKSLVNSLSIHAFSTGNAVDGFAGLITLDEVIEVRKRDFYGFVYDLQIEPHHWYFANGIVTHNCMCLLVPRVSNIKQKGSKNYADWLKNLSPEKQQELLPDWVSRINQLGMPLDKLIRPDGLGVVTRDALKQSMGDSRFNAAQALGKALTDKKWPVNKISQNNRMSQKTLGSLQAHADTPDVKRFLDKLESNQFSVSSREWHYFKYKYQYGESIKSVADIDARFDAVLKDPDAKIFNTGERYIVHSDKADRWAIIQPNGQRITAYTPTQEELDAQGKPLWLIRTLID